jgi:hypothetical protein
VQFRALSPLGSLDPSNPRIPIPDRPSKMQENTALSAFSSPLSSLVLNIPGNSCCWSFESSSNRLLGVCTPSFSLLAYGSGRYVRLEMYKRTALRTCSHGAGAANRARRCLTFGTRSVCRTWRTGFGRSKWGICFHPTSPLEEVGGEGV